MFGSNAVLRRGLATSGGAAAVTLAGWFGEHSASRSASRIASSTMESVAAKTRFMQQPKKYFSAPATETPVAKSASPSFVKWYEGHLEKNPILTKSVTGSILWGVGDIVAQLVPQLVFEEADEKDGKFEGLTYDAVRTGRAVAFGGFIHAPTSHLHFNFLEWLTVRTGVSGLAIPVFKTIMEQFVYWSWISNSMYHGAMGAMQGMTLTQIYDRIADVLMDTQKAQWVFWIPVQLLNFKFVPVRHQLNVVLLTSIVWTALLSMWYPPVERKPDADYVHPE